MVLRLSAYVTELVQDARKKATLLVDFVWSIIGITKKVEAWSLVTTKGRRKEVDRTVDNLTPETKVQATKSHRPSYIVLSYRERGRRNKTRAILK